MYRDRGLGSPQIRKYPQGGWEGKQTFTLKGLLVQSRSKGPRQAQAEPRAEGAEWPKQEAAH